MNHSTVYLKVNRVAAEICEAAREVTVADLHEAMGVTAASGLMSSSMRPLSRGARIVGPAVTAYCAAGDNLMMHRALYLAQAGNVLVVVCQSETAGAQWGDVATRYAKKKGLAGVVVHGCARDTDTVDGLGFPVWATHVSPSRPTKNGHGRVNAPVVCDGVNVRPGDLLAADGDGVVVVPKEQAAQVVAAAQARMRKEDDLLAAIQSGKPVWELSGASVAYAAMDINEIDGAFDDRPIE